MHNDSHESPQAVDVGPGYEVTDFKVPVIVGTLFFVFALMGVAIAAMYWTEREWAEGAFDGTPLTMPVTQSTEAAQRRPVPELPPGPQLQANPVEDLEVLVHQHETMLNSYGWVDEEQNLAHIPIEEAKQHILDHGMPDWSSLDEGSEENNTTPGAPSGQD